MYSLSPHLPQFKPMWPNARGLAQPGGPPGWLEESVPAGVTLYVMDVPYRLSFSIPYRLP
jgi:hypothetical protein